MAPRNSEGDGDREGFCEGHLGADSASTPHSCHPSHPLGKRQGAEAGGNLLLIPHPFPFTASFRRLKRHTGTNVTGGMVSDDLSAAVTSPDRLHGESHRPSQASCPGGPKGRDKDKMDRDMGTEVAGGFFPLSVSSYYSTGIWITYRVSPKAGED